jgi:flagellar biosynthesis protein FlhG
MKRPQAIAVTSGKGGVGKTNLAVNLGLALQRRDDRVVLFDADLALANAHIVLGSRPDRTILDALGERLPLKDILTSGPLGMKLVAGGSGLSELMGLSPDLRRHIIGSFGELGGMADHLIVDTAAGVEANVIDFVQACDRVIVIVVGEPTAFIDAYASIKVLHQDTNRVHFDIVVNKVRDEAHGRDVFKRFQTIADKFLAVELHHLGSVPNDERLQQSVSRCEPLVLVFPNSPAARAIERIAERIAQDATPIDGKPGGFFATIPQREMAGVGL